MTSSREPRDATTLRRMEDLIAAMRGRRRSTVESPPESTTGVSSLDDDRLAAAAWRAMNLAPLDATGGNDSPATRGGAQLERGAEVGRYVVERVLGAGGMGVVYEARDPELDRTVALKLVRPDRVGSEGSPDASAHAAVALEIRTRLLREAQALAQLSHRNVVAIYDVGTQDGQVWLAMELVRGQTLRQWLAQPRAWPEVLEVLDQAGRGLAAAHAAGLLHRDFKPDNVMIDADGRVRVMDFGLARARPREVERTAEPPTAPHAARIDALALPVTQAGAVMGTPLYMAPEQLRGEEATPAADQFAWCVTLWEALHGQHPFGNRSLEALVDAVLAGQVERPSLRRGVPGWLRRACERGLSVDPRRRWPSLAALLEALDRGRTRARRRRAVAIVGALAVCGVGAEAGRRYDLARRTAGCEATGDEIEAAWGRERGHALHDALLATGAHHAATTAEKLAPWLDRHAEQWRAARVEVCLDADVRGQWDAALHERARWCLDERRAELRSLVDALASGDPVVLSHAVTAAAELPAIDPCRDARVLAALGLPPEAQREAVRAVRDEVTRARSLEMAGRYEEGLALAREALARAESLDWRPLAAAARLRVGTLLETRGRLDEAEAALSDAYFEAADGVAPAVALDAATRLVHVVGIRGARHDEGRRWARHAEAALARVHDGERRGRANLLGNLAGLAWAAGDYDEARALGERSLALDEEVLGPAHPSVAARLANLAVVHGRTGEHEAAKALHARALAIREQALGSDHPYVATSLHGLAGLHDRTGDSEGAKALYARALAIREQALGPTHPEVAASLHGLADAYHGTGDDARAQPLLERALSIREAALGPEHPEVATTLGSLASVRFGRGAYADAKALLERALSIHEGALGPEHPNVATALHNLANACFELGDHARARELYARALAIREAKLSPAHVEVAHPLVGLARVALAEGRPHDALPLARRAVALREASGGPEGLLAMARFVLARSLWETSVEIGADRANARALAEQAREALLRTGPGAATQRAEVERWLAEHR